MNPVVLFITTIIGLAFSKISVYSPEVLKDKYTSNNATMTTSYANFGIIPYGHSIKGRIYYDPGNPKGCKPFGDHFVFTEGGLFTSKAEVTPIILVKRGECSFVTKIRNIEHAGGLAGIVVDDKYEDVQYVIMSDDGTGSGIRIPSMLVGSSDGSKLIDFIVDNGGTPSHAGKNRNGDWEDDDIEEDPEDFKSKKSLTKKEKE
jgi:hypothetical protein